MCFVFIWEETATCATYSINWWVFITELESVYCAVRFGALNKVGLRFVLIHFGFHFYSCQSVWRNCIENWQKWACYNQLCSPTNARNQITSYICPPLVAGLLARSQYLESPATGHLGTGFSWFPCVYKRMLRWFPRHQVATACFSCSPPDLNFLDPHFITMYMHNNHCNRVTAHLQFNILL